MLVLLPQTTRRGRGRVARDGATADHDTRDWGGPPSGGPPRLTPGGRDGLALSPQQDRPGHRDDLPDHHPELRAVPDDARLARPGPPAQPEHHDRGPRRGPRALGSRPAAPGPAGQVHRLDAAGRSRLLAPVPGPAGDRGPRGPAVADAHPVRSRRVHRDLLRAGPRRLHGLETRRRGRLRRQRVIARPLFDAVLRHRHDHPRGLRDGPRLVPDQRHVHHRGAPTTASGSRSATSRGTWPCRSSRSPSG